MSMKQGRVTVEKAILQIAPTVEIRSLVNADSDTGFLVVFASEEAAKRASDYIFENLAAIQRILSV